MCCRILGIDEIDKPQGAACPHCLSGKGCAIYATRPGECRDFYCGWLTLPMCDAKWYPADCKMVVFPAPEGTRLSIHVDPGRPDAWRREPFYSEIKSWARHVAGRDFQVLVCIGKRTFAILPDEDVDLGVVELDERVVYEREDDAGRTVLRARKIRA
jgi:hypothetical protein